MTVLTKEFLCGAVVTVFGGTGFIGSRVVDHLVEAGARVRVATRHPQSIYALRVYGRPGQVVAFPCAYQTEQDISRAVDGSDIVVNCTGILYEKRHNGFSHVHTDYPLWIARACATKGVKRFVHFSALSVDRAESEYAHSKISGERLALDCFPATTILRPSVVFGPADQFFNKFARMASMLPFLPLFGGGASKFQPVYVEDVAAAVVRVLADPATCGQVYELGGPDVVTFKQVYGLIQKYSGVEVGMIYIPWWLARLKALFLGLLPVPPLTNDQLTSLKTDNIVRDGSKGFADLGLCPISMDAVLPTYLGRYSYRGE